MLGTCGHGFLEITCPHCGKGARTGRQVVSRETAMYDEHGRELAPERENITSELVERIFQTSQWEKQREGMKVRSTFDE